MASDSNPFELVDDDGDDAPPPKPTPKPTPKPATDDGLEPLELEPDLEASAPPPAPAETPAAHAPAAENDLVEEIQLDDKPPPTKEPEPELEDEGPSDGGTVRMSLADVVSAWDEEAPAEVTAAAAAAGGPAKKDRSSMKRVLAMVLVIVAILVVIVVVFGGCAPVAHADELLDASTAELVAEDLNPRTLGIDLDGLESGPQRRLTRREAAPPGCCWRDWQVVVTPYGFLAGVKGDVFADSDTTSISIPFEDIIKRTSGGFMLNIAIGYKRWVLEFDGVYGRVGDSFNIGTTSFDVRIKQYQADLVLGYVVSGRPFGRYTGKQCCPPMDCCRHRLVVYAGARYNQTDTVLNISRPPGQILPGIQRRSTDTGNYAKPIIGLAWAQWVGRRCNYRIRADFGTGELNDETSTDLRVELTTSWQFHKRLALVLGYRLLRQHNVRESGGIREGTDLTQHGPTIGLAINF